MINMKNITRIFLWAFAAAFTLSASAQTRYQDKVFTDVKVTSNVTYGWNHTVLGWGGTPPLPVDSL
jgi:hypothetical protein